MSKYECYKCLCYFCENSDCGSSGCDGAVERGFDFSCLVSECDYFMSRKEAQGEENEKSG